MQFGIYLVENGVLTAEDFVEALKLQLCGRPPLGALAIRQRRLSCRQAFAVLKAQVDSPETRFGETAVKLGFLTDEDIAMLLIEQARCGSTFRDVLVEHRFLSSQEVEEHHRAFRQCMAAAQQPEALAV